MFWRANNRVFRWEDKDGPLSGHVILCPNLPDARYLAGALYLKLGYDKEIIEKGGMWGPIQSGIPNIIDTNYTDQEIEWFTAAIAVHDSNDKRKFRVFEPNVKDINNPFFVRMLEKIERSVNARLARRDFFDRILR